MRGFFYLKKGLRQNFLGHMFSGHLKGFLILALIFAGRGNAAAQETMMDQVSQLYIEKLVAIAKENYPRSKSLQARADAAKLNISQQTLGWLDIFNVNYVKQEQSNLNIIDPISFSGYQVSVGINLGSILRNPNNVKQARLEWTASKADQEEYARTLEGQVKLRYFTYLQNLNLLKIVSKSVFDTQSILKEARVRYERSEIPFADYNEALMAVSGSMQAKISAEAAMLQAKAALEELLTVKLEEVK